MVGFNDEDLLVNIEVLGGSSSFKIIGPSGGLHELFGSGIAYSNWSAECFFFFFQSDMETAHGSSTLKLTVS